MFETDTIIQQYIERMTMNYTTSINSIASLINAIQSRKYIVGSFSATGLSFASNPAIQNSERDARAECVRLAKLHPGKMFVFVELSGAEQVPVVTTLSI